jgi:hypothetical protein
MTDTDLHQPGPCPLRAAAEAAELAQAASRLASIDGCRLADSDPLAPLARDIAYTGTQQAMNTALGGVLRAFGYAVTLFGSGGAWLVTGCWGTEAGR